MKLVGPLAARSPALRLALAIECKGRGCATLCRERNRLLFAGRFFPRGRFARVPQEIKRHCSADEILQRRLVDLVALLDVDGTPDIPVEAGVE